MQTLDLGSLANRLVAERRVGSVVAVTSLSTGNPALQRLDQSGLDLLVSLQYAEQEQASQPGARRLGGLAELRHRAEAMALWGRFDLAVVDPFHSYDSSWECLGLALALLRPGGVMLVHDCLPPLELTQQSFVDGDWCGVTFAAFHDLGEARGLHWFTLNADFGIGVAVATGPGSTASPAADAVAQRLRSHEAALARYTLDPFLLMRAIDPDRLDDALERVTAGRPVEELIDEFPGWPSALNTETTPLPPDLRIAALERELDRAWAQLDRLARPRGQLAALSRSVPRALRARLHRARGRAT